MSWQRLPLFSVIKLTPETYLGALDPFAIFGRAAPLHVDLGCGDGSFLGDLARQNPDKNFLGIDKLAGRIAKACRNAAPLANVRVLNVESSYAIRYLLPEASVETFYLLFPDPWPKRRHHRRRIVTHDFLSSVHRALQADGVLRIATDQRDYFEQIDRTAKNHSGFGAIDFDRVERPTTKFERRFHQAGTPIYRLTLRKVSPVTNALARQPSGSNSNSTAPASS
jgi:tRNA (guanine-N7-)-methyltransferase